MRNLVFSSALGGVLFFALTHGAMAGAGNPDDPDRLARKLKNQGYHHIQINEDHQPGTQAFACKGDTHFQIEFDPAGNIEDVDPIGECHGSRGPKKVHVQAPFVDVQVGQGVRVRAPFVDLNIR